MRIATWNVNSLKARMEKLGAWLDRAQPDVLLLQETKVSDADLGRYRAVFETRGYALAHHGHGRWNGVAIASRCGLEGVVSGFGDAPRAPVADADAAATGDADPLSEARMIEARCGGVRVVSLYAPNGRTLGSSFYEAKLVWFARLRRWLAEACVPGEPLVVAGDLNVAAEDIDVWDPTACHGGTHVSPLERAAFHALEGWGLVDAYRKHHPEPRRYTWWDYRSGDFHKNFGMRIDYLLVTAPLASRVIWSDIDREARKGPPIPSDHAPLALDLDAPGVAFDPGWDGVDARVAGRLAAKTKAPKATRGAG